MEKTPKLLPDELSDEFSELEPEPGDFRFVHVAESNEQGDIIFALRSSLLELVRMRGWSRVRAAGDNYFAWSPTDQTKRVSPDVYLLDDPPTGELPLMWLTWLPGHRPPRWAVEIVSKDWRKDYDLVPCKYEELGCQELVLFDPKATLGKTRNRRRVPLTVYRRSADGRLLKVHEGSRPAWSKELGVWLVPRREGYSARLRLSGDEDGKQLIPTAEESEVASQRAFDLQKAAHDAARAALEVERAARKRAEERVEQLEQALREKEGK